MNVTVLNPEEFKNLFKRWGTFAATCYNSPLKYSEKIGKSCLETGHFSGSRTRYIEFLIEDVPRSMIDQAVRHEEGVIKNVQSMRYVDMSDFKYSTGSDIKKINEAKEIYDQNMQKTKEDYIRIIEILKSNGIEGERAKEQARGILGMDTNSALALGFDLEGLIHFMNVRLCTCSQEYIRELAHKIKNCALEIVPELKPHLVPNCEYLLWCPENSKRSCGKYPQKKELLRLYSTIKNMTNNKESK